MNETVKKTLKIILWIVITFVLLELLLLSALELIYLLSEVRLDINIDLVTETLGDLFTNIPTIISSYIDEGNPFFLLGTLVIFVYSLFLNLKGRNKNSEWETQSEGYHGSAKWSRQKDIFDNKNFESQSKRDIQSNFQKSLKKKG